MKHNPTTIIKCRFSNEVHKILEPNLGVKRSQRWKLKKDLTDKEKIEAFDKIMIIHSECSNELQNYFQDRSKKKRVNKERKARGYIPKKKTRLSDYVKTLDKNLAV